MITLGDTRARRPNSQRKLWTIDGRTKKTSVEKGRNFVGISRIQKKCLLKKQWDQTSKNI